MRRVDSDTLIAADATAPVPGKPARRATPAASTEASKGLPAVVFLGWARLAAGGASFSAGFGLALLD